jgi:chaperonin GroES
MNVMSLVAETNIAEKIDQEKLDKIGREVVEGFNNDKQSRSKWETNVKEYYDLALQVAKEKSFPWPKASNIKFPLISTAAMQFGARAYPTLVPANGKIVQIKVFGADPDKQKSARARRIANHMNYQLLVEMEEWEEDQDKLLLMLPIVGTAFKKTYYDASRKRNKSCLVFPQNLVVNYWTKSLEESYRVTEVIFLNKNEIKEKQTRKIYLDVDLGQPVIEVDKNEQKRDQEPNVVDGATPYKILEQHTYLDLDEDGYFEPYIITVDLHSEKVLRIVARFKEENIDTDVDGNVVYIKPDNYYTKFPFIPNPDGSFYDLGFGHLLGPINEAVNTIINQLVDAGTIRNLQAGFLGKGIQIRKGEQRFQPGEWKQVNAIGDDLRKQIVPLPSNEPSKVLFELLGLLIQSGKELASIAEIFVGKMPGQNTPAYTTKETVEQGMKLFTAIYKRVYRAQSREFKKIYELNKYYLDPEEYVSILDEPVQQSDYEAPPDDLIPAADPTASSNTEKMAKTEALFPLLQLGTINPMAVTMRMLEAMDETNPQELIIPPEQQQQKPDPKVEAEMAKVKIKEAESQHKMQMEEMKMALAQQEQTMNMKFEQERMRMQVQFEAIKQQLEIQKAQNAAGADAMKHRQKLQQDDEKHQVKLQHEKDKPAAKEK